MRKQISTLGVIAAGLIALASPAAAQAEGPSWYLGPEMLAESPAEATVAVIESELTLTVEGIGLEIGPCSFIGAAELWNNSTVGEGLLGTVLVQPCQTQHPECEVEIDAETTPWRLVATPMVDVEIENVRFKIKPEKNPACAAIGLGSPVLFYGTLVGPFDNETNSIEYEKAGELEVGAFGITVDGQSRLIDPEKVGVFTLK